MSAWRYISVVDSIYSNRLTANKIDSPKQNLKLFDMPDSVAYAEEIQLAIET